MESKKNDYLKRFMKASGMKAREGKLVYVSAKNHERISLLVQFVGKNAVNISEYLDNVLAEHFELHKEEMQEAYEEEKKRCNNLFE